MLSSRSWHQLAQTGPVSLLPSQHLAGTKTPGERSLEAGLRVGGCNFTSSRTGNVHEQTRLPLHLWLMTPNSDFSVLLQTPIHLFTRSLRLDMLAGTHITAYIHNGAHHLPGPLPLYLPSLAAIPTRPSAAQGGVHPPLSRLHPPEASRHHILFILISEDLTNRPHLSCPRATEAAPNGQRPGCWSSLFCSPSTARTVLLKSPTSLPQLPTHHHWTRHQCHPCPHGAQRNRQMTRPSLGLLQPCS